MSIKNNPKTKMEKNSIKRKYTNLVLDINKTNIENFVRPVWHRDFRKGHISSIRTALKNGIHFCEPITVNRKGKELVVVNGNHRIQAIREVIEKNPDFSIECTLNIYNNLNREQERELYSTINKNKVETSNDYFKSHLYDSKIFKLIEENFPVTVGFYSRSKDSRNYIHFASLLKPYISKDCTFAVIESLKRDKCIEKIIKMDERDYEIMKDFVNFFVRIFGEPNNKNIYANYYIITTIARLYYTETAGGIGEENLGKKLIELKIKNPRMLDAIPTDYGTQRLYYEMLVKSLNLMKKTGGKKQVTNMMELNNETKK